MLSAVIRHPRAVVTAFAAAVLLCAVLAAGVAVNYDPTAFLPAEASSVRALRLMENEFGGIGADVRVMARDVSVAQAMQLKKKLLDVEGVSAVAWLDDSVSLTEPLETVDAEKVAAFYSDGAALFTLTTDGEGDTLKKIRETAGESAAFSGSTVTADFAKKNINDDLKKILLFAVPTVLAVLIFSTGSWLEPPLFLLTIGAAIVMNMGTNFVFGSVSFLTQGIAAVLQLAVSMDYAIFLLHRFRALRRSGLDNVAAMRRAVRSSFSPIAAGGATTALGFLALTAMKIGIGADVGLVMAKGVLISLVCSFTLLPALTVLCSSLLDKTLHAPLLPSFKGLARLSIRLRPASLIVFVLLFALSVPAVRLTDFTFFDMYSDSDTELGKDMREIADTFPEASTLALMTHSGDTARELLLVREIEQIDGVVSVVSYVTTVGAQIPQGFARSEPAVSALVSESYSRSIITVGASAESDTAIFAARAVLETAKKYYGDTCFLAGDAETVRDLADILADDNLRTTALAVAAVAAVLLVCFRSVLLPVLLVLVIEGSIFLNCAVPYFIGGEMFYICYLIIGSLQLGATVDYAILFTHEYLLSRRLKGKKVAAVRAIKGSAPSILSSGAILFFAGIGLYILSSNSLLSQLGLLISRGTVLSVASVLFVLPALLTLFDRALKKQHQRKSDG